MSMVLTRRAVYALISLVVLAAAALVMTGRSFAETPATRPTAAQTPPPAIFPTMVRVA